MSLFQIPWGTFLPKILAKLDDILLSYHKYKKDDVFSETHCIFLSSAVDIAGTDSCFHFHVLLWAAECVFTQLRLDIDPKGRRWFWHRRSTTVVSILTLSNSSVRKKVSK